MTGVQTCALPIFIAHFGRPPTVSARGRDKQVVSVIADDRPRQVELIRLLGKGIDRLDIDAPEGAALVQLALPGHTRGGESAEGSKKSGPRAKRAGKKE